MSLFLSTIINKVDKKGRVSVPSSFRAALLADGGRVGESGEGAAASAATGSMVLFRAPNMDALEGFPVSKMHELSKRLDRFDMFSSQQDDLAMAIFAQSVELSFDADGRVTLPQDLMASIGLQGSAAFVGLGAKFQIWAPHALEIRQEQARATVRKNGLTIPHEGTV